MAENYEKQVQELFKAYASEQRIGLVLGAGVTKDSGVPNWIGLSLKLFERAKQDSSLGGMPREVKAFLEEQLDLWKGGNQSLQGIDPETVLMLVSDCVKPRSKLRKLVKDVLFEEIETRSHKMVAARTYRSNETLDAIITFCAAAKGSPIAAGRDGRAQVNRKVGAILTTNYDNLIEGAFNSKYGRHLLHPVGREGARDKLSKQQLIPVYHMHGYVSYIDDSEAPYGVKGSELVLTEKDYYETFNNPLAFFNIMAASFFRKFACVFVGCSMTDKNIRRILYLIQRERIESADFKTHFAILPRRDPSRDRFEDEVLSSFGVRSVRVPGKLEMGTEVKDILKRMYLQERGVNERHWKEVRRGKWRVAASGVRSNRKG